VKLDRTRITATTHAGPLFAVLVQCHVCLKICSSSICCKGMDNIATFPYTCLVTPVRLRIREERARKGWTQLQLARAARVPQSTISRLERRAVERLDVPILERIASALDVPLSRLMKVG